MSTSNEGDYCETSDYLTGAINNRKMINNNNYSRNYSSNTIGNQRPRTAISRATNGRRGNATGTVMSSKVDQQVLATELDTSQSHTARKKTMIIVQMDGSSHRNENTNINYN